MDLKAIHDNLERIRKAKEKLSNYAADNSTEADTANDNIASLLALGENTKKHGLSQKRSNKALQPDDSDSDNWEEVEGNEKKSRALRDENNLPKYVKLLKRFEYDS